MLEMNQINPMIFLSITKNYLEDKANILYTFIRTFYELNLLKIYFDYNL